MRNIWLKKIFRFIGRMLHNIARTIIRFLPYPVYKVTAHLFFLFALLFMMPKKHTVYQNLRTAFGREKSRTELKSIARHYFKNFARGMVDFIYFRDRPHLIRQHVAIEGKEHLDAALKEGRGVVFTGGHFGSFLLMYWRLALEGYKINVIMRRAHDDAFEDIISEIRKESHVQAIYDLPARECVVQCIKALRKNEILFILLDQNYGGSGRIFVDFFGQKSATASGPVVFSLRTQAPVLPIFCLKDKGELNHKVVIKPPVPMEEGASEEETLRLNVQTITKIIEDQVRRQPQEWGGWAHKRWKSKPLHEQEIIDRLKEQWKEPAQS